MATVLLFPGENTSTTNETMLLLGGFSTSGRYKNCATAGSNGSISIFNPNTAANTYGETAAGGMWVGAAIRLMDQLKGDFLSFVSGAVTSDQCGFKMNEDGTISAWFGYGGGIIATSAQQFELDRWYYVEAFAKGGPVGVGRMTLLVDGEPWLDCTESPLGNVVTRSVNYALIFKAPGGGSIFVDDVYTSTGLDCAPLGDITVVNVTRSAIVENTGWTAASPGSNPKASAPGQKITYRFADLPPELTGEPVSFMFLGTAKNSGGTKMQLSINGDDPVTVPTTDLPVPHSSIPASISGLQLTLESS